MANHAVFLDRDGTINEDPGYLGNPDLVKLFPGVANSIAELKNELKFKIVVISNQSGVTRGLISLVDVEAVNSRINDILSQSKTSIDAFYICPYHPDFDPREKCNCRKPSPEMVVQASKDLDVDLEKSYLIGDNESDIECGIEAGVKTILVNYSSSDEKIIRLHNDGKSPNFVASNFTKACNYIKKDFIGGD